VDSAAATTTETAPWVDSAAATTTETATAPAIQERNYAEPEAEVDSYELLEEPTEGFTTDSAAFLN
jgi:hypothetical protein